MLRCYIKKPMKPRGLTISQTYETFMFSLKIKGLKVVKFML